MQISCPSCGKTLQVGDNLAGKKVKCPCGNVLQAPAAAPSGGASSQAAQSPAGKPTTSRAPAATAPAATGRTPSPVQSSSPPLNRPATAKPPGVSPPGVSPPGVSPPGSPGVAGAAQGRSGAAKAPSNASPGAFGVSHAEVSSLFDELTAGDMTTKKKNADGDGHKKKKTDPLAAYRDAATPPGSRAKASGSKPTTQRSSDSQASMMRNMKAVCILYIFFGALYLIGSVALFFLPSEIQAKVPFAVFIVAPIYALTNIIAGIGGLMRKVWGIIGCQVVSVLYLLSFPLGTILGVYFLMNASGYKEAIQKS